MDTARCCGMGSQNLFQKSSGALSPSCLCPVLLFLLNDVLVSTGYFLSPAVMVASAEGTALDNLSQFSRTDTCVDTCKGCRRCGPQYHGHVDISDNS